jgi:hypothetical protein
LTFLLTLSIYSGATFGFGGEGGFGGGGVGGFFFFFFSLKTLL